MSNKESKLLTPIYIKPRGDTPWPEDPVFYMITSSGLFLCRNNQFYTSSVPAKRWPTELADQESSLSIRYPKMSRRLLEHVVGYFDRVAEAHGSEAAVLLAFNQQRRRVQVVVPDQVVTVSRNMWGDVYPIGVEYQIPADLDPNLTIIGDVHSHVDGAAYASYVDKHDETHRAGLHVVVGRINREPPEFHIEAVTDGVRFTVDPKQIFGGYRRRRLDVPDSWMDKITVKTYGQKYRDDATQGSQYTGSGGSTGWGSTTHDNAGHGYGTGQLNKNDGYGDYGQGCGGNGSKAGTSTTGQPPVYQLGYEPNDETSPAVDDTCDTVPEDETIHQEILDQLDETDEKDPNQKGETNDE